MLIVGNHHLFADAGNKESDCETRKKKIAGTDH